MIDLDAMVEAILARPDLVDRIRTVLGDRHEPFISVGRAADLLGVTPKTIRNWISSGRLGRYGAPRRPLVARSDVERELAPNARTFTARARRG